MDIIETVMDKAASGTLTGPEAAVYIACILAIVAIFYIIFK